MESPLELLDPLPGVDRVAVLGLGRSGLAAVRVLARLGKTVVASDTRDESNRAALEAQLPDGVALTLGENTFGDATVAVVSPGLSVLHPMVKQAHIAGVSLLSALELGARMITPPIVAITGTDGKTTTTLLVAHLLRAGGQRVVVAGNIGTPLCERLDEAQASDVVVLEVSAFQLWSSPTLCPRVLIATNIAADHLDYFGGDADYYARTKRRPLDQMQGDQVVVLNADDPEVCTWDRYTRARIAWYGRDEGRLPVSLRQGFVDGGQLTLINDRAREAVLPTDALPLRGAHNHLNALAAALGAQAMGVDAGVMGEALRRFEAPPHRIQTVVEVGGVTFIDDSKATNPHAAMAALAAMTAPVVLIAGGVDKGLALDAWCEQIRAQAASVVLIGDLKKRLREALGEGARCVDASSMAEAVSRGYALAREQGSSVVLLSPGCSSFDMFRSYSHRGEVFAEAARALTP